MAGCCLRWLLRRCLFPGCCLAAAVDSAAVAVAAAAAAVASAAAAAAATAAAAAAAVAAASDKIRSAMTDKTQLEESQVRIDRQDRQTDRQTQIR